MVDFPSLLCLFALTSASTAGAKLPPPTIFPAPGTYSNTTSLSLQDEVRDAEIHYTWEAVSRTRARRFSTLARCCSLPVSTTATRV